jgi:hypothetical protein
MPAGYKERTFGNKSGEPTVYTIEHVRKAARAWLLSPFKFAPRHFW